MAATPEQARAALTVVTGRAVAETAQVAEAAGGSASGTRAALFAAVPIIVPEYAEGAAALALDWYEEVRDAAAPPTPFTPRPFVLVDDNNLDALVAEATRSLHEIEQGVRDDLERAFAESLAEIEAQVQKAVASAFNDTVAHNAENDPDARGWQRFARSGACKFCLMLADKGAVYSATTATFAAHTNCHCVARPAYDPNYPEASPMQYVASRRRRTPAQRAALRAYLNEHFPDAPG